MAAQVAVSAPLVAGAAIFLQTVHNLGRVDLGFNPDRLVSFRIDPSLTGYERAHVEQICERILDRLRATCRASRSAHRAARRVALCFLAVGY